MEMKTVRVGYAVLDGQDWDEFMAQGNACAIAQRALRHLGHPPVGNEALLDERWKAMKEALAGPEGVYRPLNAAYSATLALVTRNPLLARECAWVAAQELGWTRGATRIERA